MGRGWVVRVRRGGGTTVRGGGFCLSVALCTWPMEADATGDGEMYEKTCERSRTPSSRLRTAKASSVGKGGTASCVQNRTCVGTE